MKQTLLTFFALVVIYLTVTSSASGPTNSGLSIPTSGCNGSSCHGYVVDTAVKIALQLVDKSTGIPVTNGLYIPNRNYEVTITGTYIPASVFGFYVAAHQAYNVQSGIFSNPPAGTAINPISNGLSVVEHTTPFPSVNGKFSVTFDWKAPQQGLYNSFFNVAVCGANGNAVADIGDRYFTQQFAFHETFIPPPSSIRKTAISSPVKIYPNPANKVLNVDIENGTKGSYQYAIYNMLGTVSSKGEINTIVNSIDISTLSSGQYFLYLTDGLGQKVINFNKQ